MTLKQAQSQVDQWIKSHGVRYFNEMTNMALLTEEVGEVARIMARRYGEQSERIGQGTRPRRRNGRCAVGALLPGQSDRS